MQIKKTIKAAYMWKDYVSNSSMYVCKRNKKMKAWRMFKWLHLHNFFPYLNNYMWGWDYDTN